MLITKTKYGDDNVQVREKILAKVIKDVYPNPDKDWVEWKKALAEQVVDHVYGTAKGSSEKSTSQKVKPTHNKEEDNSWKDNPSLKPLLEAWNTAVDKYSDEKARIEKSAEITFH